MAWSIQELLELVRAGFAEAGGDVRVEGTELHLNGIRFRFQERSSWRGWRRLLMDSLPVRRPGSADAPQRIAEMVVQRLSRKLQMQSAEAEYAARHERLKRFDSIIRLAGYAGAGSVLKALDDMTVLAVVGHLDGPMLAKAAPFLKDIAKDGDPGAALVLADSLEEEGEQHRELVDALREAYVLV